MNKKWSRMLLDVPPFGSVACETIFGLIGLCGASKFFLGRYLVLENVTVLIMCTASI